MSTHVTESNQLSSAPSFREFLDTLLTRFPDRSRAIFALRFGLDQEEAKTLEEIGKQFSITRERVRQVVDVMQKKMRTELKGRVKEPLLERVYTFLRESDGVATLSNIEETLGRGDRREGRALQALLKILPDVVSIKESDDEKPSIALTNFDRKAWSEIITSVEKALQSEKEALPFQELHALLTRVSDGPANVSEVRLRCWLAPSKKIEKNVFGQYGLCSWETIRPRGTRERAHLILKVIGKPLHFREIAALIDEHRLYKAGKKTHPQTVHNELIKDKRFVLVGRGTYALSDWGYQRGTVRQVLASILKEKATPMTREELLQAVLKVRQVKKSTVVINLNTFFAKVGKNIYTLRDTAE